MVVIKNNNKNDNNYKILFKDWNHSLWRRVYYIDISQIYNYTVYIVYTVYLLIHIHFL